MHYTWTFFRHLFLKFCSIYGYFMILLSYITFDHVVGVGLLLLLTSKEDVCVQLKGYTVDPIKKHWYLLCPVT